MSPFQLVVVLLLLAIFAAVCIFLATGKFTIRYEKTVTTINKLDDMQLEIAKANLEELKKYNENAAKNTQDNAQALHTIVSAAQAFMGVNDDEDNRS